MKKRGHIHALKRSCEEIRPFFQPHNLLEDTLFGGGGLKGESLQREKNQQQGKNFVKIYVRFYRRGQTFPFLKRLFVEAKQNP